MGEIILIFSSRKDENNENLPNVSNCPEQNEKTRKEYQNMAAQKMQKFGG